MSFLKQFMIGDAPTSEVTKGLLKTLSGKLLGSTKDEMGRLFSRSISKEVLDASDKILEHILGERHHTVKSALKMIFGINVGSTTQLLRGRSTNFNRCL
jgi:hypothetical protein